MTDDRKSNKSVVCKGVTSNHYPDYEAYRCELPPEHMGHHKSGDMEWTDAMLTWINELQDFKAQLDYPEFA